jgi:transcriptional regulator with XRE-family HTH domain
VARKKQDPSAFGRRLRALRLARGLTQVALGETTGLPQSVVTRMETAPRLNPTMETILKLADALACTPNDLLGYGATPTDGR